MDIKLGNISAKKIYNGSVEIAKAYVKNKEVYSSTPITPWWIPKITKTTNDGSSNLVCEIPENNAGDLMLIFFTYAHTSMFISKPSGWTERGSYTSSSGTSMYWWIYSKISTGGETTATVGSNGYPAVGTVLVFSGVEDLKVSAQSTSQDPPSLTSGYSAGTETLWIACVGYSKTGSDCYISAYPDNCDELQNDNHIVKAGTGFACAVNTDPSFDPTTFTIAGTPNGRGSYTLALRRAI